MQHSSDVQVRFCLSSVHASVSVTAILMLLFPFKSETTHTQENALVGGQVKQKHVPLLSIIIVTHQLFTFHMYVDKLF